MSWSVNAIGKPAAVAAKLIEEFSRPPCVQPEEDVRQAAAAVVFAAVKAQAANSAVVVIASGNQTPIYGSDGKPTGEVQNTLSI